MNYVLHILTMVAIYAMLATSLNLILGYTGLLSMCHAAFYGIGAYTAALLMLNLHLGFLPSACIAILFAGLLSLVISTPALRLRGDYLVLATLGFQMIVYNVAYNWQALTGGSYGISGIPTPKILGIDFSSVAAYSVLSVVVAIAYLFVCMRLVRSPFGRLLKSIREDEVAAESLGKNVASVKVTAFAISAALAAIPGVLFAGYAQFIDPTSFGIMESIFILSVVAVGGAGNLLGPILGALLMVVMPEALRFLHVTDSIAGNVRQIVFGLALVALMRFRPQGLLGSYKLD